MITPRHHALSLAAVFLALAIGVVLGSGLLSGPLLSGLRDEKRDLRSQIDALQDQQNVLNEKLNTANDFDAQMAGRMVHDELADKSVVVFRSPNASDDDVDAVARLVRQAGGTVTGTLSLTEQFVDANSAEKLRAVVESGIVPAGAQLSTNLVDQGSQAGDLLGIALLINPNPAVLPADDHQRDTVLAALRDTGFITFGDAHGDQHIGAANAAVVITGGPLGDDAGNKGASVARFAAALAPHGTATVLAGRDGCASGTAAVAVTRADAGMAGTISTVDNVDAESGRITVIMATSSLINGGHPAQYGIGHGAGSVTVAQ
ncbi:MAG TPA: copper transporter [Mycobacterium sp.]|nr:copper transporter [Mycobacterium sp.]